MHKLTKLYGLYLEGWSWWRRTKLCRLYWKILHRYHSKHQYNRLDTKLPPGYYDLDIQILYAVMNNFREFYERGTSTLNRNADWNKIMAENVDDCLNWYESMYVVKQEFDIIYDWWVHRYSKITHDHEIYWKNYNKRDIEWDAPEIFAVDQVQDNMRELEEKLEEEANEMLARLMKYRQHLWD